MGRFGEAVAEEDDVLEARLRLAQLIGRREQATVDEGGTIGHDLAQAIIDHVLRRGPLEVDDPPIGGVHGQHPDLVGCLQGSDGPGRSVAGYCRLRHPTVDPIAAPEPVLPVLVAVARPHRAAGIDGQNLGHRLAAEGVGDLADHREELFQVTVPIPAEGIGVGSPQHDEPPPQIPNGPGEGGEVAVAEVPTIDVGQHDRRVAGQLVDGRERRGAGLVDGQAPGSQHGGQIIGHPSSPGHD